MEMFETRIWTAEFDTVIVCMYPRSISTYFFLKIFLKPWPEKYAEIDSPMTALTHGLSS